MDAKEREKVKNYLKGYAREDEKLRQIEEDIDYINQTLDSTPQLFDGMPRGSGISDKTAKTGQKLWGLYIDLMAQRDKAVAKRKEIGDTIRSMEDTTYMRLLYLRYIELKSWGKVSEEMGISPRWIFDMHNKALEEILKKIPHTALNHQ